MEIGRLLFPRSSVFIRASVWKSNQLWPYLEPVERRHSYIQELDRRSTKYIPVNCVYWMGRGKWQMNRRSDRDIEGQELGSIVVLRLFGIIMRLGGRNDTDRDVFKEASYINKELKSWTPPFVSGLPCFLLGSPQDSSISLTPYCFNAKNVLLITTHFPGRKVLTSRPRPPCCYYWNQQK